MSGIVIAGAGALGSYLAFEFLKAGRQTHLLARETRLKELNDRGLQFAQNGSLQSRSIIACTDSAGLECTGIVILACKTGNLIEIAETVRPIVSESTSILTVQNGVEAPQIVAEIFPYATVLASRVHGFFQLEEGIIRHVGIQPSLTFGTIHGRDRSGEGRLAAALQDADIAYSVSPDIRAELWEKMLLSSALGGVGAAFGIPVGKVLEADESAGLLREAMEEVVAVAHTLGISLPKGCIDQNLDFIASFPREATTSMQRDLEAGLPSEYHSLAGAILRLGKAAGLAMPVHLRLDAMIGARIAHSRMTSS